MLFAICVLLDCPGVWVIFSLCWAVVKRKDKHSFDHCHRQNHSYDDDDNDDDDDSDDEVARHNFRCLSVGYNEWQ